MLTERKGYAFARAAGAFIFAAFAASQRSGSFSATSFAEDRLV